MSQYSQTIAQKHSNLLVWYKFKLLQQFAALCSDYHPCAVKTALCWLVRHQKEHPVDKNTDTVISKSFAEELTDQLLTQITWGHKMLCVHVCRHMHVQTWYLSWR